MLFQKFLDNLAILSEYSVSRAGSKLLERAVPYLAVPVILWDVLSIQIPSLGYMHQINISFDLFGIMSELLDSLQLLKP